jgi:hypothetical protein
MGNGENMKLRERRIYAYNLKVSGKTCREVGEILGCSGSNASSLVLRHKREMETWVKLRNSNSILPALIEAKVGNLTRISNCLRHAFGREIEHISLIDVAKMGGRGLLARKHLGKKSVREIVGIFVLRGLIDEEEAGWWMWEGFGSRCNYVIKKLEEKLEEERRRTEPCVEAVLF